MKVVMVSNYINHHQIPFSKAMYEKLGDDYHFIQTEEMEQKRVDMGWAVDPHTIPYVVMSYEDQDRAKKLIDESDLLLVGWMEDESIIRDRLTSGKMVLRISERLYREGQWKFISPKGLIRKFKDHTRLRKYPVYLLCNGAYVASDFKLIHAYQGRMYKFGYFPKSRNYYDTNELWRRKPTLNRVEVEYKEELPEEPPVLTDHEIQIIWAGRFIELKHPEYMVRLASDLVRRGYRFHIHMVGSGDMEDELHALAEYEMIEDYISFHGFMSPEKVRDLMEECHIHIFTSNFLEGWGAVVNEAMNAGCAEIANDEVGAAPYLITNNKNGMLYHEGKYEDMLACVTALFDRPELISRFGKAAYDTIVNEWNAEVASDRVLEFYKNWTGRYANVPQSGPMSIAPIIKPRFFANGKLKD